jgi:hypothetical protein
MKDNSSKKMYPFLVLVLLAACTIEAQDISIKVYPEIQLQKIKSIGGNYSQTRYTSSAWDAIGE